jgi:hypothetical protein
MKKIIIAVALATAAVSTTYAQGLVVFGNNNFSKVSTNSAVGGSAAGAAAGASSFYYALFYSQTSTTVGGSGAAFSGTNSAYAFSSTGWSDSTLIATNSGATAGRFASSSSDSLLNSIVSGLGTVQTANFVVIGWSANIGSTVSALSQFLANPTPGVIGWFGESAVSGSIITGNGTSQTTPTLFGNTGSPVIPGFVLGEVVGTPEPGTLALCALGGASMLLFRRKK